MTGVEFVVHGVPVAQGSKRHVGRGILVESSRHLQPWRSSVTAAAGAAMRGRELLDGPVALVVVFVFPRPKHHYGAHGLKAAAPLWVEKKPDVEKLVRAIGDAVTGVVVRDDAQVVELVARKVYGEQAKAVIRLELLAAAAQSRAA